MILPIYAYGQPILKKVAEEIDKNYEGLSDLIENMWETMYNADGVGLAAPQIGRSVRLFLIDTTQAYEEEGAGLKRAFLNAQVLDEWDEIWAYEEGCLSIPDIRGDVDRHKKVRIKYQDENFKEYEEVFDGINARVIQHEYDHIEGKLFTEKLKPIRKRRVKKKLEAIRRGEVESTYRLTFARK